jgi:hypothetical protein
MITMSQGLFYFSMFFGHYGLWGSLCWFKTYDTPRTIATGRYELIHLEHEI